MTAAELRALAERATKASGQMQSMECYHDYMTAVRRELPRLLAALELAERVEGEKELEHVNTGDFDDYCSCDLCGEVSPRKCDDVRQIAHAPTCELRRFREAGATA